MASFSFVLQVNYKDHKLFTLLHIPNLLMKFLQTLENKAPNKGGKEEQWERTQVRAKGAITLSGSQNNKGTNYVPEHPLVTRNISQKESERKLENVINLKKPSLTMMAHFKIDITCDLCKAIDTLCL